VEVKCRGFTSQSLWKAFKSLGVTGKTRKKAAAEAGKKAEEASILGYGEIGKKIMMDKLIGFWLGLITPDSAPLGTAPKHSVKRIST
jgi:hypothetical protein